MAQYPETPSPGIKPRRLAPSNYIFLAIIHQYSTYFNLDGRTVQFDIMVCFHILPTSVFGVLVNSLVREICIFLS